MTANNLPPSLENAPDNAQLQAEFDALMRRSGITVIPDRYQGTLDNYAEMRKLAALLRQPRSAEAEPANIFSIKAVLRTLENDDERPA